MTIIRSHILSKFPEIVFGMSTTEGGVSEGTLGLNLSFNVQDDPGHVRENRRRFFGELGIIESSIAFTKQEHTDIIRHVDVPGPNGTCDALVTSTAGLFLAISIADCTPVMLYDPVTGTIAGIHAGWRGTAAQIVPKTVEFMIATHNVIAKDIVAFIGPSAGVCCYEVGEDVALQFPEGCRTPAQSGKWMLDVRKANALQLIDSGVNSANIETDPSCSIHQPLFHSHRRDGKGSGRMFAVIGRRS